MNNLLLVPTPAEAKLVRDSLGSDHPQWSLQICGFGPIAAAARSSMLIARHSPERIILVGIAGSYDIKECPVSSARAFDEVACYGVGIGSGRNYTSAIELGWLPFDGDERDPKIGDRIKIDCGYHSGGASGGLLLTAPTASADKDDARRRLEEFPEALCEDMEGFAIAISCLTASVPMCAVRGISNSVGERNKDDWDIDGAMRSACNIVREMIGTTPTS